MLSFIKSYLKYFTIWVIYFIIARIVFLAYHKERTQLLDFQEIMNTFFYGIRLDLSTAAYFSVIPFFLLALRELFHTNRFILPTLKVYTYILAGLSSFLISADLELYANWGFRLDDLALHVLKAPAETAASAGASPVGFLISIVIMLAVSLSYTFNKIVFEPLKSITPLTTPLLGSRIMKNVSGVFLMVLLIIPIRGGFQLAPINQSSAYFSHKTFANHAAINAIWNFMISIYEDTSNTTNPFPYFETPKANAIIADLFKKDTTGTNYLIKKDIKNPNVIIITWESLTAKAIERLGGAKGVTPQFDSLCQQGILFNNYYSTGHRTHFGLMGVLAGGVEIRFCR